MTRRFIDLTEWVTFPLPFTELLAEVGDDKRVPREIGLDELGRVVFKVPSSEFPGYRGLSNSAEFAIDAPGEAVKAGRIRPPLGGTDGLR